MKLSYLYLLFFIFFFVDVKAQKMIVIEDVEENLQYTIKSNDKVDIIKDGDTIYKKYQIGSILEYGFTCTSENKLDTIKFTQINAIRLRSIGTYQRTFYAFAGMAVIIDLMIVLHDFSSGTASSTAYLIGAPVTIVVLPAIGAAIFHKLIFPKDKIGFSGKYKWKIVN